MVEKSAWAGQGVSPHPHPQPSFCLPPSTIFVGASRPSPGIVTAHANTTYGPRVTGDPCKSQVNDVTFFSGNFFCMSISFAPTGPIVTALRGKTLVKRLWPLLLTPHYKFHSLYFYSFLPIMCFMHLILVLVFQSHYQHASLYLEELYMNNGRFLDTRLLTR